MNKKLSLSKISKNAICEEEKRNVKGGHVSGECYKLWQSYGSTGGASNEQYYNHCTAPLFSAEYMRAVVESMFRP